MKLGYCLLFGLVTLGVGLALLYRHIRGRGRLSADGEVDSKFTVATAPEVDASLEPALAKVDESIPSVTVSPLVAEEPPVKDGLCSNIDHTAGEDLFSRPLPIGAGDSTPNGERDSLAVIDKAVGDQAAGVSQSVTRPRETEVIVPQPVPAPPAARNHRTVQPFKRGGGHTRAAEGDIHARGAKQKRQHERKPELICFESAREWILAAEFPEDTETDEVEVYQQGVLLPRDERNERCWRLSQAFGIVDVRYAEGQSFTIDLGNMDLLLFKLSGEDHKRGRRVRMASSGAYLIVAAEHWTRFGLETGRAEPVSVVGYKAHYFILDDERREPIAFKSGSDQPLTVGSVEAEFELVGESKVKTCDDLGPLFTGEPPRIRARSSEQWQEVKAVILGLEGAGRAKWRSEIKPLYGEMEQSLPDTLRVHRGGWYFLRLYDWNDELLESLDFRYLRDLTRIKTSAVSPLPEAEGHKQVIVEFEHRPGCLIEVAGPDSRINLECHDTWSIARIPACPSLDQTRWAVRITAQRKVEFNLLTERIWWAINDTDAPSRQSDWTDKPIETERNYFLPTSAKTLHIWVPKPGWVREVCIGCDSTRRRRYAVRSGGRSISVSLRDFSDTPELWDSAGMVELRLWLCREDRELQAVLLYTAPKEKEVLIPPPPVQRLPIPSLANCTNCNHARVRLGFVRCRRHHWNPVLYGVFTQLHCGDQCPEWLGD